MKCFSLAHHIWMSEQLTAHGGNRRTQKNLLKVVRSSPRPRRLRVFSADSGSWRKTFGALRGLIQEDGRSAEKFSENFLLTAVQFRIMVWSLETLINLLASALLSLVSQKLLPNKH